MRITMQVGISSPQVEIPEWKNPIVNAAIDYGLLAANNIYNFSVEVNGEPATIYTPIKDGDVIRLIVEKS